jgi:type I restriction enzyme S subunit
MVNMGELFAHRRIGHIEMERVPLNERRPERDVLQPLDLLFARQSLVAEGAGKACIFLGTGEPVTFESHLIRARINPAKADPMWLFYYFESPEGRGRMRSIVNQVAAAGIRGSDLSRLSIPCPDLTVQRRSAVILRSIDDKIDSNRRMGSLIQQVVATLFQGRFIDPFPLSSHDAIKPDDWSWAVLGELLSQHRELITGDTGLPYIGLSEMPRCSTILSAWLSEKAPSGQANRFGRGDILFGKLRPYFRKVGVALIDGRCSLEILVLRPRDKRYWGFALGHAASQAFIDHCVAVSRGTRMPRAEWRDAGSFPVRVPPPKAAEEHTEIARDLYAKISGLVMESRTLASVRDALLPKLVSGEIRVSDATDPNKAIGAAAEKVAE